MMLGGRAMGELGLAGVEEWESWERRSGEGGCVSVGWAASSINVRIRYQNAIATIIHLPHGGTQRAAQSCPIALRLLRERGSTGKGPLKRTCTAGRSLQWQEQLNREAAGQVSSAPAV